MQHPESIDLRSVTEALAGVFRHHPPQGYLRGRTLMRDHLQQSLGYSAVDAEELIDTLEARGFLRFDASPGSPLRAQTPWTIDTDRIE